MINQQLFSKCKLLPDSGLGNPSWPRCVIETHGASTCQVTVMQSDPASIKQREPIMTWHNSPRHPLSSQTLLLLCRWQWDRQIPHRQRGSRHSPHHCPEQCLAQRLLHSVGKTEKRETCKFILKAVNRIHPCESAFIIYYDVTVWSKVSVFWAHRRYKLSFHVGRIFGFLSPCLQSTWELKEVEETMCFDFGWRLIKHVQCRLHRCVSVLRNWGKK